MNVNSVLNSKPVKFFSAVSHEKVNTLPNRFSNESFEEVTAYLSADQKNELAERLNRLPNQELISKELVKSIAENTLIQDVRNASHPLSQVFFSKDFSDYLFLALRDRKISGLAYTTAQQFHSVLSQHSRNVVQHVSLFQGETINPEAYEMVESSSKVFSGLTFGNPAIQKYVEKLALGKESKGAEISHMNHEEIRRFFDLMKEIPPFEQQYFLVPDNRSRFVGSIGDTLKSNSITQRFAVFGVEALTRITKNGQNYIVIPSKGMMQAYLVAKFGSDAVTMVTRLGLAPLDDMLDMIQVGQRPYAVDNPKDPIKEADSYVLVQKLMEASHHDFYHALLMSYILKSERVKFYQLARMIKNEINSGMLSPEEQNDFEIMYRRLVDMEHYLFKRAALNREQITEEVTLEAMKLCHPKYDPTKKENENKIPDMEMEKLQQLEKSYRKMKSKSKSENYYYSNGPRKLDDKITLKDLTKFARKSKYKFIKDMALELLEDRILGNKEDRLEFTKIIRNR